jgi:hypothetical protein
VKSIWPFVWTIVGVIVLGEVGLLFWSGRLPALFSHGTGITTDGWSNVQQLTQQDLTVHVVTPPSFGAVIPQLQNWSAKQFTRIRPRSIHGSGG